MKDVLEMAVWAVLVATLVFLFRGDPSVFDLLQQKAMAALSGSKP